MSKEYCTDEIVYCFFDTNILLQFQMFDEVDWLGVLTAAAVCLVVAPIILRELSDFKDDSRNERRQRRVRDILPKLEKVLPEGLQSAGQVRPGVSIRDLPLEPSVRWEALGLDPQIHDDRLIASILEFKAQQPSVDVCLITADVPLRRKARYHGIRVVDPGTKLKYLPFVATPAEIENQKLRREVQALKNRSPKIEFGFWENDVLATKVQSPLAGMRDGYATDEQRTAEIMTLRAKYQTIAAQARDEIANHEVDDYMEQYREYLVRLRLALHMKRSHDYGPRCTLTFVLKNTGLSPATDLSLDLTFPPGSFVVGVKASDLWTEVVMPEEPVPSWTLHPGLRGLHTRLLVPPIRTASVPIPKRRGPLYDLDGDRRVVQFADSKFSQDSQWVLPPVMACLPPGPRTGFAIEYRLRADELPKAIKGTLHMLWETR